MRAEGALHDWKATPCLPVGARGRARAGAGAARPQARCDDRAPIDSRASVRLHKGLDGRHALQDEDAEACCHGDGIACAGLQSEAGKWRSPGYPGCSGRSEQLRPTLLSAAKADTCSPTASYRSWPLSRSPSRSYRALSRPKKNSKPSLRNTQRRIWRCNSPQARASATSRSNQFLKL